MVNVEGDSIGAGIVHHLSRKDLKEAEIRDDQQSCTNKAYDDENDKRTAKEQNDDIIIGNGDTIIGQINDRKIDDTKM